MNKQDGIEGRALEFYFEEVETRINGVDEDVVTLMTNFARTETATITAERDRLKEALRSIQHITDGHGCGRYRVLCSACEATRIAMEALIDDNGDA